VETVKSYPAVLTPLRRGTVGQVPLGAEEEEVVDERLEVVEVDRELVELDRVLVELDRVLVEVVRALLELELEPGKH